MRKFSRYALIKKIKSHSHISIFFNDRLDKPIRYGYKYLQRSMREPRRLKFLKVNVRHPRIPVRRKTKYGRRLELRQKSSYLLHIGRLKKLVSKSKFLSKPGQASRFSNFAAFRFFDLHNMVHAFGFSESPSFNFFLGRYFFKSKIQFGSISRSFSSLGFHHFNFPQSGAFFFYALRVFFYRLYLKNVPIYLTKRSFLINFNTFSSYSYKPNFIFPAHFNKIYDFKFGQFSFGRLR